ncbi:MAG: hypothetical protein HYZ89_01180 [Candidatus Omnitrophica bacterium]|nr:hypothetical protein [Candidatus Omnitrophota bacterium]
MPSKAHSQKIQRRRSQPSHEATTIGFNPTDIFAALNAAGIQYMVVGGLAVILYGFNRYTSDLDLAVDLTVENLKELESALQSIGFVRRLPVSIQGLAIPTTRRLWTRKRSMKVYSFIEGKPPARTIDVMVKPLRSFKEAYGRRVMTTVQGVPVPLIPVDLLAQMKREAGRPEDLLDLKALRELGRISS